jgi:transposase InsO family protein
VNLLSITGGGQSSQAPCGSNQAYVAQTSVWARAREGVADLTGLIHHSYRGSQYTWTPFTERLPDAGVGSSVGSLGDAYDNALAETVVGLFKTELILRPGPCCTVEHVEWRPWTTSTGSTTGASSNPTRPHPSRARSRHAGAIQGHPNREGACSRARV